MGRVIGRFARAEAGATAIEYALIAAFIAIAIITALTDVGSALMGIFNNVKNGL